MAELDFCATKSEKQLENNLSQKHVAESKNSLLYDETHPPLPRNRCRDTRAGETSGTSVARPSK